MRSHPGLVGKEDVPRGRARSGELGAGAGQDDDAVVAVRADVVKSFRQFAVR